MSIITISMQCKKWHNEGLSSRLSVIYTGICDSIFCAVGSSNAICLSATESWLGTKQGNGDEDSLGYLCECRISQIVTSKLISTANYPSEP